MITWTQQWWLMMLLHTVNNNQGLWMLIFRIYLHNTNQCSSCTVWKMIQISISSQSGPCRGVPARSVHKRRQLRWGGHELYYCCRKVYIERLSTLFSMYGKFNVKILVSGKEYNTMLISLRRLRTWSTIKNTW